MMLDSCFGSAFFGVCTPPQPQKAPKFFTHYLTKPPCFLKHIQQKQPPAWLAHEMLRRGVTETNLQSGVPCSIYQEEVATMNAIKRASMKAGLLTSSAMLAMFAFGPYAHATPVQMVQIGFNGAGGSGHVSLTVGPDNTPSEPAGPSDPAGAQLITGASGTFTNSTFGNVTITGVLARNFATPFDMQPGGSWQPGYLPFPASFSQLAASGTSAQDNGVITYDDLFYADGSPQTCWDYPFFGGFLDPYGVMFSLSNGGYLDLWSFGVVPPDFFGPGSGGLTYGMAVIQSIPGGGYEVLAGAPFASASVPEPKFLWLFGIGVLGLFAWRRSAELRKASRTG